MNSEDRLYDVYYEVENKGLKPLFDKQLENMKYQNKHRYKEIADKWEYALYRIKGGKSKEKY
tara:strand:+ start:2747 stop:2932 length:186 start_codon:yes stop_codon:yes gene_type:complete